MASKPKSEISEIEMSHIDIKNEQVTYHLIGRTPLVCNSISVEVLSGLLIPKPKKNSAEKASSLKHNPMKEFRVSMYKFSDIDDAPTRIFYPCVNFKKAMGTAALDLPGMQKSRIGRLVNIAGYGGDKVPIYGVPELMMSVVRNAGVTGAPDVRTRAVLRHWCCEITVRFTTPLIRSSIIDQLISVAGINSGVGDWRQEKGSGNFGSFAVCTEEEMATFNMIKKNGGRDAQDAAIESPGFYDRTTEELMDHWQSEARAQGFLAPDGTLADHVDVSTKKPSKRNGGEARA